MKFRFSEVYSDEEMAIIEAHGFRIMSEISLSKIAFTAEEAPRRMLAYGGCYFGEIPDDEEENGFVWAMLSKNRKGAYYFGSYSGNLMDIVEGL